MEMKRLLLGACVALGLVESAGALDFDLRTGSASVAGPTSVQLWNVTYDGVRQSGIVNLRTDGGYSVAGYPIDSGGGTVDFRSGRAYIASATAIRLADVTYQNQLISGTLDFSTPGLWRASNVVPARFPINSDFDNGSLIWYGYTCAGANLTPALWWGGAPSQARSFAIIMDDPDAGARPFVHWNAFNIPSTVTSLLAGQQVGLTVDNDFHLHGYAGPCPLGPTRHTYYLAVYALSEIIELPAKSMTRSEFETAYGGVILSKGELSGYYP